MLEKESAYTSHAKSKGTLGRAWQLLRGKRVQALEDAAKHARTRQAKGAPQIGETPLRHWQKAFREEYGKFREDLRAKGSWDEVNDLHAHANSSQLVIDRAETNAKGRLLQKDLARQSKVNKAFGDRERHLADELSKERTAVNRARNIATNTGLGVAGAGAAATGAVMYKRKHAAATGLIGPTSVTKAKGTLGRFWEKLTGSRVGALKAQRKKSVERLDRELKFMAGPNFKPTRRQQGTIERAVAARAEHEDPERMRLTLEAGAKLNRSGKVQHAEFRRSARHMRELGDEEEAVSRARAYTGAAAGLSAAAGTHYGFKHLRNKKRQELRAKKASLDPIDAFTQTLLEWM